MIARVSKPKRYLSHLILVKKGTLWPLECLIALLGSVKNRTYEYAVGQWEQLANAFASK